MKKIFLMSVFAMLALSMVSIVSAIPWIPCGTTEVSSCDLFTTEESCNSLKIIAGTTGSSCLWNAAGEGSGCMQFGCRQLPQCQGAPVSSCADVTDSDTCVNSVYVSEISRNGIELYRTCRWANSGRNMVCLANSVSPQCLVPKACADADGDGYLDAACGGDDCDDTNAEVNPGMIEIVGDAFDNDCDGTAVCDSSAGWQNHGQFVSCVARETSNRGGEVTLAAQSLTGKAVFGDGQTTWLGLTSIVSVIALAIVSVVAFNKLHR